MRRFSSPNHHITLSLPLPRIGFFSHFVQQHFVYKRTFATLSKKLYILNAPVPSFGYMRLLLLLHERVTIVINIDKPFARKNLVLYYLREKYDFITNATL